MSFIKLDAKVCGTKVNQRSTTQNRKQKVQMGRRKVGEMSIGERSLPNRKYANMHTNVIAATSQSLPSHKQHHHCHSQQCLQGCVLLEHVCNGHACTVPQLVGAETALRQKRDVTVDAASGVQMHWL